MTHRTYAVRSPNAYSRLITQIKPTAVFVTHLTLVLEVLTAAYQFLHRKIQKD